MDFDGVVEGVALNEDYRVRDQAPATRVTSDEKLIIIIAEEDGVDLRVVTVTLPDYEGCIGEEMQLGVKGSGAPYLKASVGELDDFTRSDGVHVLNSKNTRFSAALGGSLFLDQDESGQLIGSFIADMEDGGHLEGSFVIQDR
jgi:hypothetical protein